MIDMSKTRKQLIEELVELRQQVVELKNGLTEDSNSGITEHSKMEIMSEESDERYRLIAENTTDLIALTTFDLKATFLYVSPSYKNNLGYTSDELIGKSSIDFVHPGDKKRLLPLLKKYFVEKSKWLFNKTDAPLTEMIELRMRDKSGKWHDLKCMANMAGDKILFISKDVTENKLAEKALRESEEQFRTLMEQSPFGIIIHDLDGVMIQANKSWAEIWNVTNPGDVIGKFNIFNDPQLRSQGFDKLIRRALKGETVVVPEIVYDPKVSGQPGRKRTIASRIYPLRDRENRIKNFVITLEDITERKQAEEVIQEGERKLSTLMSNLPGMAFRCKNQKNWPMQFVSEGSLETTGYRPEDFMSQKIVFNDLILPEDREYVWKVVQEAVKHKHRYVVEYRIRTLSGQTKWLWEKGTGIFSEDDQLLGLEGFITDITERKQAERARRNSEQRFKDLAEMLPETIFETDKEINLTFINRNAFELFGYSKKDIEKGLNGLELLVPEDRNRARANLAMRLKGEDPGPVEYQALKKDGSTLPVRFHANSIMKNGELIGLRGIIIDITERKQAEEEVSKSREFLDTIINNIANPIFVKDEKHRWIAINDSMCKMIGVTRAQMLGKSDYDLFSKEQADVFWSHDNVVMDSNKVDINEEKITVGDKTRIISTIKSSFTNPISGRRNLVGTIRDITDRKLAEKQLQESEERFKKLSGLTFEGIVIHYKGVAIDVNESLTRLFGYTREEMIGENIIELCVPQEYHTIINENVVKKYAKPYEVMGIKKDGTLFPIELEARDIKNKDEEFRVAAIRDITERKQAKVALQDSKKRFRNIAESMSDWIWELDADGVYTHVSSNVESTLGYKADELIGKRPFDFMAPKEAESKEKQFLLVVANKKPIKELENWNIAKDGNKICFLTNGLPLLDNQGNLLGYRGVDKDITELKRLQKLESRAERLETAGTIAGQVAHDFNNLLAPLIAYPDFIKDELPKNHPALTYLDQMEKAAQKIANINQDLLAMGRRGHCNQDILNLNTIIQQAVADFEPLPKTLAFEIDLDDSLMDILGGGAQIHRVISNMLHNAQDAMQNIGQITIKTENYYVDDVSMIYGRVPKGEYVKLTMTDTGCGIPDDIVQKIFDPFFTSKTTDKKCGSGLGMSVVDAVINDHNGFIDLSTKVGEGTSFYLYFPITRKSKDEKQDIDIYGGSESILIVDDDEVQRQVTSQILKKLGYQITSVKSGEKAVELIKDKQYELLILDMIMPDGMDGAETYRRILEISPNQKSIIVSGFSESERVIEAQKLGVGVFVQKPLTKEAIASAVRNELDRQKTIAIF